MGFERWRILSWLDKKMVLIIVLYLTVMALGIYGVFNSNLFDSMPEYLFLTPSFLNDTKLNWTTSVWAGVLGIHGTIAALSITFMGMFVSQVSSYSEAGFKDICKSLLLRRNNFLSFSLNSIFSLLCGIVLLACGGGIIAYIISIAVSLFFILSYGLMYLKLYDVTENPTVITDYLFTELKSTGERYYYFNLHLQEITNSFNLCCEALSHIESGWPVDFLTMDQRSLEVFPEKSKLVLSGFCPVCLNEIDSVIKDSAGNSKIVLRMNLNFYQNISNSSFSIEFEKERPLDEKIIFQIENMLKKALQTKKVNPVEIALYQKYEQAVVQNIRSSLLKGSESGIDFGVKSLLTLTDKNHVVRTINALDHSFGYSNKKNNIDYAILAAFFEKVSTEILLKNNFKIASEVMGSIINLGRYLYTNDYFYEFYRLISQSLHHRARYGFGDDDFSILDLYLYTVRQNLMAKNYMAFELNTKFLTNELRYLEHANDGESLSVIESKMVQFVKSIVTLILIRLSYLLDNIKQEKDEFNNLCNYLESWCNAAFLEDVYYKEGTYDALFIIPNEPDFDASRILREIPDYEVTSISISNDTYRAIAFLMTQSPFNNNKFNPIFIRDKKDFLENTGITTHQLQSIITYLRSDHFIRMLEAVKEGSSDKANGEVISEALEGIIHEKNNLLSKYIIESELNDDLVQKYKNEVTVYFKRHLDKILDVNELPVSNTIASDTSFYIINKREVLKPIDGVHYSMSGGIYAEKGIYNWVKVTLNKIKSKPKNILKINNLDELPTHKLITIKNKIENESGVYRYCKGLRMTDSEGVLELGDSGLYYMDFENEFLFRKGRTLFDIMIEKITDKNIESIGGANVFADENPFLYALMSLRVNLELIEKTKYNFYFLSIDKCRELAALSDRRVHLSFDKETVLDGSQNIS
ncbi:hypothetical protein [Citrobacter portucalensis]|uniref:hypothetical protein n=1 Tax=Citrobacter portucalensis TaxID=1639133 RepID=UPI003A8AAF4F